MRNTKPNERGAVAAEFAVVLPILVILLFSIIEFGLTLNRVQTFNSAAREGARVASLPNTTQSQIETAVNDALAGMTLGVTPVIPPPPEGLCAGRPGQSVTVKVTAPYTIQIPLLPNYDITLTGTGVFRCE